jgi:demethylmenaquinone methyltransferase/2-methoxy-6-polyprenyl-1,4-benzoquinol methylase
MNFHQEYSRVHRPVEAAGDYYSRLSAFYDLLAASEKKFIRQGLEALNPSPDERILEIGFGTGYAQLIIAKAIGEGFSAGLDLSGGMSKITQKKVVQAGLSDRVGLVQSNTLPIPFQKDVFDGIISSFTLELFDSPLIPQVLNECRRVLKPAGRIVIISLSKDQPLPWAARLYESLHNRYPKLLDCRPIPVQSLVSEAGFHIKGVQEAYMWGLPVVILLAKN